MLNRVFFYVFASEQSTIVLSTVSAGGRAERGPTALVSALPPAGAAASAHLAVRPSPLH